MKKFMVYILAVLVVSLGILTGCQKTEKKEPKEPKKTESDSNEKEESKPLEEEIEEAQQTVYYKDWSEEYRGTSFEEIPKVSENGNEYSFDEKFLGYYTNGYVGLYFNQIDGSRVLVDVFLYDYFIGMTTAEVMDKNTISFVYEPGMTESDIDTGVYKSELSHFETNTIFEDNKVTFNSTAQLGHNFIASILGQGMAPYFLDMTLNNDGVYDEFERLELGIYDKKDISELNELKLTNSHNPMWEYDEGCYYENNQPLTDRMSKENYPKYVKYIPSHKYYIAGGNPKNNEDFMLLKVMTGEEAAFPEMWSRIKIKIGLYHYFDGKWYTNVSDIKVDSDKWAESTTVNASWLGGNASYNFNNFNYELPEYICTTINDDGYLLADIESYMTAEEVVRENIRSEGGRYNIRKLTLDCTDSEKLRFDIEDSKGFLTDIKLTMPGELEGETELEIPFSITNDTIFEAVEDETFLTEAGVILN